MNISLYHIDLLSHFFFFNDTATTEIYTLSLHDVFRSATSAFSVSPCREARRFSSSSRACIDRKSTRLNSSHPTISYAVFCLKKKHNLFIATETHQGSLVDSFLVAESHA